MYRKLHPHHRLPRGRGGTDDLSNRAWLCYECHISGVHGHNAPDWREWID